MSQITIAVIVGSLRKEAYTKKISAALQSSAPREVNIHYIDYINVPFFNEDLEADVPAAVTSLKTSIEAADAVIFITPEYNRSIPGVLKNAIDWASRPYGNNSFMQKPGAVIGAGVSPLGGFGAVHHLRQVLAYLDMHVLAQPELYIGQVHEKFGQHGQPTDKALQPRLEKFWQAFIPFVRRHR